MATQISSLQPLVITPGVMPSTDSTSFSTEHYTFSDKIRFQNGKPQKIGGWRSFAFSNGVAIEGYARSIYSTTISNSVKTLIGTNEKLYYLIGQSLFNITPLNTDTVAIADSLATDYGTLASNPITTTLGSNTLTIADVNAAKYQVNDDVKLSGAAAVGGVPNTDINANQVIRSIGVGSYTIRVATTASSGATGGGASVVRATGRMTVTAAAHGQANGDRTKIDGAADTGGILAADINKEFIIRNVAAGTFDIMTDGFATSSVSGGGGAATTYQKEIDDGLVNQGFGQGYGMGKYGVGRYGVSKSSSAGIAYPRIWFFDRFANTGIMTPGNQTGVYAWTGTSDTAPELLTNAPTAVNYAFVSNNIVVTFGAGDTPNRIFASDQGDPTNWTASSTNQVFDDDVEGAERLISHVPAAGVNLIFTGNQTYIFSYLGLPAIWSIQLLDNSIGIIGPMARCSVNNVAFWMGQSNFYCWRGGNIEIISANSQYQSTILNYVFQNINRGQAYKSFAWYNAIFNEIWFHYPSNGSNECDRVARVDLNNMTWAPDTFDRLCAEYPDDLLFNPRMIDENGTLFIHEYGVDADGEALEWQLSSNLRTSGKNNGLISGFMPDSITSGTLQTQVRTWLYPQSVNPVFNNTFDVASTAGQIPISGGGRFWQYDWSGSEIGQNFIMGNWQEFIQPGAPN